MLSCFALQSAAHHEARSLPEPNLSWWFFPLHKKSHRLKTQPNPFQSLASEKRTCFSRPLQHEQNQQPPFQKKKNTIKRQDFRLRIAKTSGAVPGTPRKYPRLGVRARWFQKSGSSLEFGSGQKVENLTSHRVDGPKVPTLPPKWAPLSKLYHQNGRNSGKLTLGSYHQNMAFPKVGLATQGVGNSPWAQKVTHHGQGSKHSRDWNCANPSANPNLQRPTYPKWTYPTSKP